MISVANLFSKVIFLSSSLLLAGCLRKETPVNEIKELAGQVFGSHYLIKYRGPLEKEDFQTELDVFFKEFNHEFSTYQKDSMISLFNNLPAHKPLNVSSRFIEMLKLAERFYRETEGAFDPTLGPVIRLWGFGGGAKKETPSTEDLKTALKKTGLQYVKWDDQKNTVWKEKDGLILDVNAFAPGWATDLIAQMLKKKNVHHFMIDISGDILFHGMKSEDAPWIAGIEKPSEKYAQAIQLAFRIKDQAISTSGSYRQFFDEKGVRRSHIIDPRTGKPVSHSISSASVVAPSGVEADVWSTAMMVLGASGLSLSEKHGMKVILLEAQKPNVFSELISPSMQGFIEANGL